MVWVNRRWSGADALIGRLGQHLPEFLSLYNFFLREEMGEIIQDFPAFRQNFAHPLMSLFHHGGDFLINLGRLCFAVGFIGGIVFGEEHRLASGLIGHQSQAIA